MSYHRITVIGHAGSEPDLQVSKSGQEVANFPIYVNERFGELERTTRYKIKVWGKLSTIAADHLHTGQLVVVDGTPSVETWMNGENEPRAQMIVTAISMKFLGPKPIPSADE